MKIRQGKILKLFLCEVAYVFFGGPLELFLHNLFSFSDFCLQNTFNAGSKTSFETPACVKNAFKKVSKSLKILQCTVRLFILFSEHEKTQKLKLRMYSLLETPSSVNELCWHLCCLHNKTTWVARARENSNDNKKCQQSEFSVCVILSWAEKRQNIPLCSGQIFWDSLLIKESVAWWKNCVMMW